MEVPEGVNPETFKRLLEDYKKALPEKMDQIKKDFAALKSQWNLERLKSLRFTIHKLAGNAATFGFEKVSSLCKKWDQTLSKMIEDKNVKELSGQMEKELSTLIQTLEKEFFHG